jgi:hypothetical protein
MSDRQKEYEIYSEKSKIIEKNCEEYKKILADLEEEERRKNFSISGHLDSIRNLGNTDNWLGSDQEAKST